MTIHSVFVVNRAGGLIYQYDHNMPKIEVEKTFSYPLELVLKLLDEKVVVAFGQRDGVKVGHTVLGINGLSASGRQLEDGRDILETIADEDNYPIAIKFGRPKLTVNEKIMLASMFHSLFAIGSQLSPEPHSSGIEVLETDVFKLHCFQTMTGIKFIVLTDLRQGAVDGLLKKLYEVYSDFALKNPFYSIDMPIRCELFEQNLQSAIEQAERTGISNI
ncbi:trafficking protein particle complex subunit 4 [Lingula anatina]|uniref:Trafficking protein particle complex subunit n=1 Tax=Lingula anatina TaxID=7574 RepID=A0A1S3H2S1_LINAN|nr:trafficking protein particle complex subunit 4 [Lingula anatina]|eukprot:XP_013380242.1 trafficking protein particle complex subunit 4 [Lingula anatina]